MREWRASFLNVISSAKSTNKFLDDLIECVWYIKAYNLCLYFYIFTLVVFIGREKEQIQSFYLYIKPSRSFREKRWKVCAPRSLPFLIRFSVSRSSFCRRNFSCAKIARSLIQLMVIYGRAGRVNVLNKSSILYFLSLYLTSPRKQMVEKLIR